MQNAVILQDLEIRVENTELMRKKVTWKIFSYVDYGIFAVDYSFLTRGVTI